MNYIKKLERETRIKNMQMEAMKDEIEELRKYISSSKFNCGDELDGYVNTKDIESRLQNILRIPGEIESELGFRE